MEKDGLKRVENGHPRQCQAIRPGVGTQCNFEAVDGGRNCIMHGGNKTIESSKVQSLNMYRLKKYKDKVAHFAHSDRLKTVDEEIGILRVVLEELLNSIDSDMDLLLYSQKIGELVRDITKCVQVADKLATKSGMLIGRAEALIIGQKVVDIVSKFVTDEDQLLSLAEQISDAFMTKMESSDSTMMSLTESSRV